MPKRAEITANMLSKYYNRGVKLKTTTNFAVKRGFVKHAGAATLETLAIFLAQIRQEERLRERTPGSFYLKSSGFLHFHEDLTGIFADLKIDGRFERFPVTTPSEQQAFLEKFRDLMSTLKN